MNSIITPLASEYLDCVWAIEKQAHSHPWKESNIRDLNSRGACHYVLQHSGELVGYFYAQDILGEVTLLNIAVSPSHQGKGYGKQLLRGFLDICEASNANSVWLEVRESNQRAFYLYESLGFNEVDRRIGYYPTASGKEDAIIMSYLFL